MIDLLLAVLSTVGALAILFASIGILRMPDFYLRLSVTVKASSLGVGLLLLCAAIMFPDDASVLTKALAIIFFLFITTPIAAHMIARAAYFIGTYLWKGTIVDELDGMYDKDTHKLHSDPDDAVQKSTGPDNDQIADTEEETK